jgi:hypothetical protein
MTFRRSMLLCFALAALGPLLALTGCAGTRDAYKAAETPEEYAYVLTEHYAGLLNQSANLAALPTTPESAKTAMKKASAEVQKIISGDATAVPRVPGIKELVANYKQVRNAQTQAELQAAVDQLVLKLADLVRSYKAAGGR